MRYSLLVPVLVFALVGCIPTGGKPEESPRLPNATEVQSSESAESCCSEPSSGEGDSTTVAKKVTPVAREVELRSIKYNALTEVIRSQRGKVIVVDIWASYCRPCMEEFPHLVQLHQKYAGDGLLCISISVDESAAHPAALKFLKKVGATFLNYRLDEDPSLWQEKWLLKGIPAVFVFDRQGRRAAKFTNDDPDDQFTYGEQVEPLVRKLLEAK